MTVPVSNRLSQLYVGNGVNTRFDFMFRAFGQENATGIAVRVKVGSEFEPLDDSLYEVTLNQDGLGGYITFTSPPSASTFFYINGHTPVDQLLDITNYDNFYPDAIERALDKITAILQEWGSLIDFEEQSRILADINYDLLAQARETDLKNYIDTIVANITGAPLVESQFVTYVDSVSDLPTLLKWDGRIAYVKDVSHFEYKESSDTWGLKITPIAAGGTGSTTEEGARAKLDVYSQAEVDLKIDEATPDASTEVKGLAKIATTAIAKTGANDTDFLTAKKLWDALSVTGLAPIYACRAWVNFNAVPLSGTYTQSGGTVTVTMANHGMTVGQVVNLTVTSGNAGQGNLIITSVPDVNTFTYTAAVAMNTAGNMTRNLFIKASGNITSVTDNGVGDYTINFDRPMPDANYAVTFGTSDVASGSATPKVLTGSSSATVPHLKSTYQVRVGHTSSADTFDFSVVVFR